MVLVIHVHKDFNLEGDGLIKCALRQSDWHVTCVLAQRLVCPLHGVVREARRAVLEVEAAR